MQTIVLPDPAPVFERYERLLAEADALFGRVAAAHPECVSCGGGCSDCCHALFDLPLIEAMYLHYSFSRAFPLGPERSAILERAGDIDRHIHKIKRSVFHAAQKGEDSDAIFASVGRERCRCPLLGDDERCLLYNQRPATCRVYGIPTAIGGKGYTCSKSRFEPGKPYPTVQMEKIQERLAGLSLDLSQLLGARYDEVHTVLVPVSMALLTTYDAAYFGLVKPSAKSSGRGGRHG